LYSGEAIKSPSQAAIRAPSETAADGCPDAASTSPS
jgi:hypothetical protein